MFAHAGFRPLWPVIFFLPLFFIGVAFILESVRHRRSAMLPIHQLYAADPRTKVEAKPRDVRQ